MMAIDVTIVKKKNQGGTLPLTFYIYLAPGKGEGNLAFE